MLFQRILLLCSHKSLSQRPNIGERVVTLNLLIWTHLINNFNKFTKLIITIISRILKTGTLIFKLDRGCVTLERVTYNWPCYFFPSHPLHNAIVPVVGPYTTGTKEHSLAFFLLPTLIKRHFLALVVVFPLCYNAKSTLHRYCCSIVECKRQSYKNRRKLSYKKRRNLYHYKRREVSLYNHIKIGGSYHITRGGIYIITRGERYHCVLGKDGGDIIFKMRKEGSMGGEAQTPTSWVEDPLFGCTAFIASCMEFLVAMQRLHTAQPLFNYTWNNLDCGLGDMATYHLLVVVVFPYIKGDWYSVVVLSFHVSVLLQPAVGAVVLFPVFSVRLILRFSNLTASVLTFLNLVKNPQKSKTLGSNPILPSSSSIPFSIILSSVVLTSLVVTVIQGIQKNLSRQLIINKLVSTSSLLVQHQPWYNL
ncbi:putative signal peptide protein [Puccinia sorghi]|uniref:Putative signal peptide protein n=1 Tax=Puccinia sorghi TaxID=27349 RepID=A0A0L6VB93_9BASI|nr:putative signal peptide protein [Puccinia sorghi]